MTDPSRSADDAPDDVVLEPIAKDQAFVLDNLAQLYAHDFSEHVPLALGPDGRFAVAFGDKWWTEEGHFPFFVRVKGSLAGFALVRKGSRVTGAPDVMDIAELFVVRGARKQKVGARVAQALFRAFPGAWDIRVRETNTAAKLFWAHVAEAATGRSISPMPFTKEGVAWNAFRIPALD